MGQVKIPADVKREIEVFAGITGRTQAELVAESWREYRLRHASEFREGLRWASSVLGDAATASVAASGMPTEQVERLRSAFDQSERARSEQVSALNDCRLTLRCLKECFDLRLPLDRSFESLRVENSFIDTFFERRLNDHLGGEGGTRILQVKTKPTFALHYGRLRGATWFERDIAPMNVVWLLGAEMHDDRHKGARDAYDIFGRQDSAGHLFPLELDYQRRELDLRRDDMESFATDALEDARKLIAGAVTSERATGQVASVPVRLACGDEDGLVVVYCAISQEAVRGPRSGLDFPLTQERFLLLGEAIRQAAEDLFGPEVLCEEVFEFPDDLRNDRAFVLLFERH